MSIRSDLEGIIGTRMIMVELIRDRLHLTSTDDNIEKPRHIKTWTLKNKRDYFSLLKINFSRSLINQACITSS